MEVRWYVVAALVLPLFSLFCFRQRLAKLSLVSCPLWSEAMGEVFRSVSRQLSMARQPLTNYFQTLSGGGLLKIQSLLPMRVPTPRNCMLFNQGLYMGSKLITFIARLILRTSIFSCLILTSHSSPEFLPLLRFTLASVMHMRPRPALSSRKSSASWLRKGPPQSLQLDTPSVAPSPNLTPFSSHSTSRPLPSRL